MKLADFGLAKIIGEESFTTSLYVLPSDHSKEFADIKQLWNPKLLVTAIASPI